VVVGARLFSKIREKVHERRFANLSRRMLWQRCEDKPTWQGAYLLWPDNEHLHWELPLPCWHRVVRSLILKKMADEQNLVLFERRGNVALFTLNRPGAMNAINQ
jgi:hypothetical protein